MVDLRADKMTNKQQPSSHQQEKGGPASSLQNGQDPISSKKYNHINDVKHPETEQPLSWADARDRLRCTLKQWKEERKQFRRSGISTDNRIVDDPGDEEQEDKNDELVFSWKSLEDPDLPLVTIPLATLSFLLPSRIIIQQ